MNEEVETSKTSGVHHQLSKLAGDWKGTARVWFQPDKVEDESPVTGTMRLVLDGRFIMHEYKGSFAGNPLEGIAIYGYDLNLKRIQSAWVDSFHNNTAIMFSQGNRGEQHLSMLGSYTYISPEDEQVWGWRTEINIENDNRVIITAYNVSPSGEEAKATEIEYEKVK